jgi:hypothetical protein
VTRLNLDSGYVVEQFPECSYPIDTQIAHIQHLNDIMYIYIHIWKSTFWRIRGFLVSFRLYISLTKVTHGNPSFFQ